MPRSESRESWWFPSCLRATGQEWQAKRAGGSLWVYPLSSRSPGWANLAAPNPFPPLRHWAAVHYPEETPCFHPNGPVELKDDLKLSQGAPGPGRRPGPPRVPTEPLSVLSDVEAPQGWQAGTAAHASRKAAQGTRLCPDRPRHRPRPQPLPSQAQTSRLVPPAAAGDTHGVPTTSTSVVAPRRGNIVRQPPPPAPPVTSSVTSGRPRGEVSTSGHRRQSGGAHRPKGAGASSPSILPPGYAAHPSQGHAWASVLKAQQP